MDSPRKARRPDRPMTPHLAPKAFDPPIPGITLKRTSPSGREEIVQPSRPLYCRRCGKAVQQHPFPQLCPDCGPVFRETRQHCEYCGAWCEGAGACPNCGLQSLEL